MRGTLSLRRRHGDLVRGVARAVVPQSVLHPHCSRIARRLFLHPRRTRLTGRQNGSPSLPQLRRRPGLYHSCTLRFQRCVPSHPFPGNSCHHRILSFQRAAYRRSWPRPAAITRSRRHYLARILRWHRTDDRQLFLAHLAAGTQPLQLLNAERMVRHRPGPLLDFAQLLALAAAHAHSTHRAAR